MSVASMELLPNPESLNDTPVVDTEVRVLKPEEAELLRPVFERAGADLPDPSVSFIVGLVENGKPTESFLVIQGVLHAEPLNLEPRHRPYLKSIAHAAEREIVSRIGIANVFLFAPQGDVADLAGVFGMQPHEWVVMSKTVGPVGEPS